MPSEVAKIQQDHVESFIEDQLKRWTPNTAANKMKPPRQPEVLAPVIEVGQLEKLLRVCQGQSFEGIRQLIERRAREAGLGKIHVHQLRHTFAHHWLSDGGQESDLMRIAVWRSPQMLRRYASSAGQERALAAARKVGIGNRI